LALCIYKTRFEKTGHKNAETPDFSEVSGECIYFGHSRWSVRPIEIFAEIHDFQGFAGLHPLFFCRFAAMAADFPPEGQF
jgi:hypothetical protein